MSQRNTTPVQRGNSRILNPGSSSSVLIDRDVRRQAFVTSNWKYPTTKAAALQEASASATENDLYAATDILLAILSTKFSVTLANVPYAIMGGLAIKLRGKPDRFTHDVDMAIGGGKTLANLIAALENTQE